MTHVGSQRHREKIINKYYNVINAKYYYYISNKGLLEECDKEENLEVTGAAASSCLKIRLYNLVSNVTYSPSHRHASAPLISFQ